MADTLSDSSNIPLWTVGQVITAEALNAPIGKLNEILSGVKPAVQVESAPGVSAVVAQVQLTTLARDLNMCKMFVNGVASGAEFPVAKPRALRHLGDTTTVNGITYTRVSAQKRTATRGSDSETQVVTPTYFVGAVFYAVGNIENGPIKALDSNGVLIDCEWVDLNTDAREWAKEAV